MVQVLCVQLYALVVLNMELELLVADHSVTKETVLVSSLFGFVIHQLVREVFFDGAMDLLNLLFVMGGKELMGSRHVGYMGIVMVMRHEVLSLNHMIVCVVMLWSFMVRVAVRVTV